MRETIELAREFLAGKFAEDAQYRPIHLSFEELAALLAEFVQKQG